MVTAGQGHCRGAAVNRTDITIVLYGLELDAIRATADCLLKSQEMIGRVWILLSGNELEQHQLRGALREAGIASMVDLECRFDNLGFATGHNVLLRRAFDSGAERALVLNPDVQFSREALKRLVDQSATLPKSLLGPTLAQLNPSTPNDLKRVDSLGIDWAVSARHFDRDQGRPWFVETGPPYLVSGITGACLLVPRHAFFKIADSTGHFFDDLFIAYREDAELGVRAGRIGVSSYVLPVEGFEHIRANRGFQRTDPLINMLGVRNRFLILWTLGKHRPGTTLLKLFRDVLVVLASLTIERTSVLGLRDAWAVRRYQSAVRRTISAESAYGSGESSDDVV